MAAAAAAAAAMVAGRLAAANASAFASGPASPNESGMRLSRGGVAAASSGWRGRLQSIFPKSRASWT
jgi:hypothetical protein